MAEPQSHLIFKIRVQFFYSSQLLNRALVVSRIVTANLLTVFNVGILNGSTFAYVGGCAATEMAVSNKVERIVNKWVREINFFALLY